MKHIFLVIFIAILIHISAGNVMAQTPVSGASAHFKKVEEVPVVDNRAEVLERFLQSYNSPLANDSEDIVRIADEHGIPWTWIPAISGVESTFCKAIPYQSYNCWGWANGAYNFEDYDDAVSIISKSLKERYVDRGADTIEKIAPIYAPPSTTWSGKVNFFISKLEDFEKTNTTNLPISL